MKDMYLVNYGISREGITTLGKHLFVDKIEDIKLAIHRENIAAGEFIFFYTGISKVSYEDYLRLKEELEEFNQLMELTEIKKVFY